MTVTRMFYVADCRDQNLSIVVLRDQKTDRDAFVKIGIWNSIKINPAVTQSAGIHPLHQHQRKLERFQ